MFRTKLRTWSFLALLGLFGGCGDETSGDADDEFWTGPVEFRIESVENAAGDQVEEDGPPLALGCDEALIVTVGPRVDDGRLDNWLMRPSGNCGDLEQCGYVLVEVLGEDDAPLASVRAALATPLVRVPSALAESTRLVRATLMQGERDRPFRVDGEAFVDEVPLRLTPAADCGDDGGFGGDSPTPPGEAGAPALAGAGGTN